ncbi:helix-turn-helix domain-containing protein [Gordonia hankookensis]|uniref:Helix-turn-helix transcriptional regulator n=1 Tax=Gordonia hankookensis TaxID=589403 RepID=A0ABR7WE48_9ACTN|nr:helix-turn-helix transcriptional regulator [Gordonia hankookensis]MBD1321056.1 helix-turn-helix transcriptional regulator [Gordonia hankookensis]NDZ96629.1 helix-turn-helix transcriptional regulator [Streptomyces sp. SID11726]NEB23353.1 helix-turn-helix transcriptional regulator [Streptomyces sp. SID6673]NED62720.1 helix-turn-helix transcriptional regulator [Streptomyces sp. SID10244]
MDAGLQRAEPLWREVTGRVIRRHRHDRGERLVETARRAGVSSQYLSEIERGRKDASSELLAAVAGALGLTLLDLTREVTVELSRRTAVPVLRAVTAQAPAVAPMGAIRGPLALAA